MFKVRSEDLHIFTRKENDALNRVGPATAMGNLFRQYWDGAGRRQESRARIRAGR